MPLAASAPGKLILMGEHSAVYGRPALAAAVALRTRARFAPGSSGVELDLADLGRRETTEWSELARYARRVREAWESYRDDPNPVTFAALSAGDETHVARVALGEAVAALESAPPPATVTVTSELPIGSGFGSSAALAVALIGGLLAFAGRRPEAEVVDRLALEVERRQHGQPSGVDHSTALHGGVLWAARGPRGALEIEPLGLARERLRHFEVYQTGQPAESTGEVVAAVHDLAERDRRAFDRVLDRMETQVEELRAALAAQEFDATAPIAPVRGFERCLEELGVVPEAVRRATRAVEEAGGAAKISGAGALSGDAAGCLLAYRPAGPPRSDDPLAPFERYGAGLGAPGLTVEEVA